MGSYTTTKISSQKNILYRNISNVIWKEILKSANKGLLMTQVHHKISARNNMHKNEWWFPLCVR